MSYTVEFSDSSLTPLTIDDNTINTDTSLSFTGKGYKSYGEVVAENFLHLLENFSNSSEPNNPILGQLWYDKDADSLKVYTEKDNGTKIYGEVVTNVEGTARINGTENIHPTINIQNKQIFDNPTNTNRIGDMAFLFKNTDEDNVFTGSIRYESLNSTAGSERTRAFFNVKTGANNDDWTGIYFGYDNDAHSNGFGSISLATSPTGNDPDLLLTGQKAVFSIPITLKSYATADLPTGNEGDITYDSDKNKLVFYDGSSWSEITGGTTGSSTFVGLTDSPSSITANGFVRGNSAGDALVFTSGDLTESDIPDLPASKITSGVFDVGRFATGGSDGQFLQRTASGTQWATGSGGSSVFSDGTDGVYYNGSKNVGIGLTDPSSKLEVDGTITASGEITAYSDERLKENIRAIDNPLDKILNMRGVLYNRIGEEEQKIGLIAQEVQEVVPQVIKEGEYLSISYGNLVGLLIEAIKELKEEVNILKN